MPPHTKRASGNPLKKPWALTGAKGRPAQLIKSLFLGPGEMEIHNLDLKKKYDAMEQHEVMYETRYLEDADIMIIAFGTPSRIAKTAIQFFTSGRHTGGLTQANYLISISIQSNT